MAGIRNEHLLTDIFGYWPTFCEARVLSVLLDHDPEHYAALEARIHVFEMTSEVDEAGHFVFKNHTIVVLRFQGLADVEICDFWPANVLEGLEIERISPENRAVSFAVEFDAINGFGDSFKCQGISVTSVEPYEVS
jgi:hypothetical protein